MNHITFRDKAEKVMVMYMNELPSCITISQRMMLLEEINKLSETIKTIDDMPFSLARREVISYWVTIESKLNEL